MIFEKSFDALRKPFNNQWIADFRSFVKFIQKYTKTKAIIKTLYQEKMSDHVAFLDSFSKVVMVLGEFQNQNKNKVFQNALSLIDADLKEMKGFSKKVEDPFFRAEDLFYRFNTEISKVAHQTEIECYSVDLQEKQVLKTCETEADKLRGVREVSQWGNWDRVLELFEWVKGGIANDEFAQNIRNVFYKFQYTHSIQSLGLYILSELELGENNDSKPVHAIELYLDGLNNYWILLHRDKSELPEPYHIKRLNEGNALKLLEMLLKTNPNTEIEYKGKLSHDLGELKIKGEMAKVFFPQRNKFAGAHVELLTMGVPVDTDKILTGLYNLQASKKKQTPFNRNEYYTNSYLYNRPF